jgi:RNA polymerase sigma-70 factor (ECF subfamily)
MIFGLTRSPGSPSRSRGMHVIPFRRRSAASAVPITVDIEAVVAGDRRETERLVRELLPRVKNLVRYLIRGDADVDDVAQDALLAIVRGVSGYRGDGELSSWADRVVARSVFAWIAKRRTDQARYVHTDDQGRWPDPEAVPPDKYLARREVVAKLDRLPFEQRHALVLHHVLGMSVPEVAAELGIPAETVRSRLRVGITKLREAYAPRPKQRVG